MKFGIFQSWYLNPSQTDKNIIPMSKKPNIPSNDIIASKRRSACNFKLLFTLSKDKLVTKFQGENKENYVNSKMGLFR